MPAVATWPDRVHHDGALDEVGLKRSAATAGLTGSLMSPRGVSLPREARPEPRVLQLVALVERRVDVELDATCASCPRNRSAGAASSESSAGDVGSLPSPHLPVPEPAEVGLDVALERDVEPGAGVADGERLEFRVPPAGRELLLGGRDAAERPVPRAPPARAPSRAASGGPPRAEAWPGILKSPLRSSAIHSAPNRSMARPSSAAAGKQPGRGDRAAGETAASQSSLFSNHGRRPSGSTPRRPR